MTIKRPTLVLFYAGSALAAGGALLTAAPADVDFFEQKIRPVLAEKCFECHSTESKNLKGNLLLDTREGLLKGGDTGPAIVPGAPDKSLLISAIAYTDPETAMPPKKAGGKLPAGTLEDFHAWVQAGAPWPASASAPKKNSKKFDLAQRKAEHWCWTPPLVHTPPPVRNTAWPRSLSDHFILAKLEAAGLTPAPKTDRNTLLRRVTFDLTGLPPRPEELSKFLSDDGPDAFANAVDRLLASPQFGERWTRHWMDLVRYAESRGHEFDAPIPNAWQYRDYLVRAFNEDVPFDQFTREHIAGDLIPPRLAKASGSNESILGTGFWFLTEEVHSPVDLRQDEADRLDNRLDVMSKSFLGLTVACARCHDHKFDAISQKDYYALTGFLISSSQRLARFETIEQERKACAELESIREDITPALSRATAAALRVGIEKLSPVLSGARDAILSGTEPSNPQLAQWKAELQAAQKDPEHLLHRFAKAWLSPTAAPLQPPVPSPPARSGASATVLIADYTLPSKTSFIQDGFAFGNGPLLPGTVLPSLSPDKAIETVVVLPAARRHSAWKNISGKGELDPGKLASFKRSGQSLRTPEFVLGGGSLWYLVRGAGIAYAAVDSHLFINGPLHGKMLTNWKNTGRWEWVQHDLKDYAGQRAHVELMPEGKDDFEIAMVVESETKPALPAAFTLKAAAVIPGGIEPLSVLLKALHEGTQTLATAGGRTERATLAGTDPALQTLPQSLLIADWMVRSLDLFCPIGTPERTELLNTTRPLIARYQKSATSFNPESQLATTMFDGSGADEFLLKRGSPKTPMAPVPRRFVEAIAGPEPLAPKSGSGRRELAELIASPGNPLTSRVIVNRVWHHLFGSGIVPTVDNFGVLGQAPSHQELLDTLAVRFATEQKWSLKTLIRELVLSNAYAMSSKPASPAAEEQDPQNTLLHRMNLKRLEGEAIRDSILTVSGRLNLKMGGPSVPVYLTSFMDGRGRPNSGPLDGDGRRSLYIAIKRNFLSPMMLAFDTPIPFNTMGRRNVSNVPAQSLVLMNDPFVVAQATVWAKALPSSVPAAERLRRMYLSAFSREPLPDETSEALLFLTEQANALSTSTDDPKVWADLAHVLFNAKEFIHLN